MSAFTAAVEILRGVKYDGNARGDDSFSEESATLLVRALVQAARDDIEQHAQPPRRTPTASRTCGSTPAHSPRSIASIAVQEVLRCVDHALDEMGATEMNAVLPRPKFIQITNSNAFNRNDFEYEQLYALDVDGGVWFYDFVDNSWNRLADDPPEPVIADGGDNA